MDYYTLVNFATDQFGFDGQGDGAFESKQGLEPVSILPYTVLTYVSDRLYLASYTTPPSADTLFPYPDPPTSRRSPSKRSARVDGPSAILSDRDRTPPCYFSIDDTLLYNAFHHDFGPLHIGHLYRFAVQFHDILGAPENKNRPVVFWSKADARSESKDRIISEKILMCVQVVRMLHVCWHRIWFSSNHGLHIWHLRP